MKKAIVLLLACLMAVNVSAQKTKATTAKKATTSKTSSAKKSSSSKKKASDATLPKGTFFFNTNATNVSFNSITFAVNDGSASTSLTRFGLQATGGYGIIDNLALVGGLGFQYGKMQDTSVTAFTFNAGARYYIVSGFYASGMFVLGTMNMGGGGRDNKGHTFGLDLGVGYSYFLTPRIAIEPNFSYSIGLSNKMADVDYKLNALTFNIGFTILL